MILKIISLSFLVFLSACAGLPSPSPEENAALNAFVLPETPLAGKSLVYVISAAPSTSGSGKNKPHGMLVHIGDKSEYLDANEFTSFQVDPRGIKVSIKAMCMGNAASLKSAIESGLQRTGPSGVHSFFLLSGREDRGENFNPEPNKTYFLYANRGCFLNIYNSTSNTAGNIKLVDDETGRYLLFKASRRQQGS